MAGFPAKGVKFPPAKAKGGALSPKPVQGKVGGGGKAMPKMPMVPKKGARGC